MNWRGIWHLGTRYLRRNRAKTILLISAFTLVWLLPSVVNVVVTEAEKQLRSRAEQTPLVLGRTGSPLELTFNGVYFTKPDLAPFQLREATSIGEEMPVIPLYARFAAQENRIVGTSIDYFRFRNFKLHQGRPFLTLGECVIGSTLAKERQLNVGDFVISSPESLLDLAGVYPLKMKICGIIAPTGSPDDNAIFVDLKTTWIIEGLVHGHNEADKVEEDKILEKSETGKITLNAALHTYNEVTPENAKSFHFHGDQGDFPITAAIVIPKDSRSQALLKGRFQSRTDMQIVSPAKEMEELFDTVFRIQKVITVILILIGLATLAIGFLVFSLSYRLRISEFQHLSNMGADQMFLRFLIAFEALFVLGCSLLLTGGILLIVKIAAPFFIKRFLG